MDKKKEREEEENEERERKEEDDVNENKINLIHQWVDHVCSVQEQLQIGLGLWQ